ncbi:MAG: putative transporter, permease component [Geminicoccaceae bacterium]|nr:putative transporter, permease component [Geminicoccaceae bacterium]
MRGLPLAWRLARRELRGGVKGFVVFLACLTLGVGAIAAVGVINAGVIEGLQRDASALLGGDIQIEASNLPLAEDELAALVPPGALRSDAVRTSAMAQARNGRRVAVALKAVDSAYPLYGQVALDPASLSLGDALADGGVVVERGLLARLGLALGDPLRIGEAEFEIRAVLEREPDRIGGYVSIGPRVMIRLEELARTRTILPGSLARYAYGLALPEGRDAEAELARIRAVDPEARWRARGTRDVQPQIVRFTDRLASYLTLAGLTALLIGGVGVALAIQNYLAGKTTTIAILKCLGGSSGLIFRVYLLQVLALAGAGILLGLTIGLAAPWLLQALAAPLLPIQVVTGWYPLPLLIAGGAGLLTALVFAIWPLARAREVSPAAMFRALIAPPARRPPGRVLALLGLSVLGLALLALLGVADRWLGLIFIGVALGAAGLLAGLAALMLRAVRLVGRRGGARMRIALANLHRPGAGAAGVITALGAGLAVLTMVALIERNLAAEVDLRLPERAPSLFLIDLQRDLEGALAALVTETAGAEVLQTAPVIRGRVVRIKGVPVDQTGVEHWSLRRDRGLSYGAAMPEGTELVAGAWWPEDYAGPPLVSVEDEVALAYGVGVGDRLAFNVLGRIVEAEIASLRAEIDWGQARLDFVFLFSPGVLEAAPHTLAAAVDVPPAAEAALLERLADELPNVTPISVRELVARAEEVMGKIKLAVAAVAGVTLLSGVLVLAGAVAAARRRHLYEAVVLKVLGGATAALVGGVLGSAGAAAVVVFAMDLPWTFSPGAVLAVLLIALALTLTAGFLGTWRLLGRPAGPVLRTP